MKILKCIVDCFYFLISFCYVIFHFTYIAIRCKITRTHYSEGGKFGMGFPEGFYKLKNGIRYYESGTVSIADYRGICKRIVSSEQLKKILEEE